MVEYRITKYDPSLRDANGAYMRRDWISISDIGKSFNGEVLTAEGYQRVEDAYVATVLGFLNESGVATLCVTGLESWGNSSLVEGQSISCGEVPSILRSLLREEIWCQLESPDAFVPAGHDYYLYVGSSRECSRTERLAAELGLFAERFSSPYKEAQSDQPDDGRT
jgi:hypothetical protein